MNTLELIKRCPFCGSDDVEILGGKGSTPAFWCSCSECGAEQDISFTRKGAIKKWNTRAAVFDSNSYRAAFEDGFNAALEAVSATKRRKS